MRAAELTVKPRVSGNPSRMSTTGCHGEEKKDKAGEVEIEQPHCGVPGWCDSILNNSRSMEAKVFRETAVMEKDEVTGRYN